MRLPLLAAAAIVLTAAAPPALAPSEIVAKAPANDWVEIAASDLLIMDLTPDPGSGAGASRKPRRVIIQLIPPPFSQGWVGNIRKLAAARWWDGTSINRVQDNYVVQWGDANAEDKAKAKVLPGGLERVPQDNYTVGAGSVVSRLSNSALDVLGESGDDDAVPDRRFRDSYGGFSDLVAGWPLASDFPLNGSGARAWPVHCYGMVGVGRDLSPDTGTGAELYTVIGHAPRHLDRNIALVGRVIEGIEHLSSLPRGKAALGFYDKPEQRVPIVSIRLATDLPAAQRPRFHYLSTESSSFASYADARANRRDAFFVTPAGGADICNIPVPVRRVP